MKKEALLKILEQEKKLAKDSYDFHKKHGDKYHLAFWFNGQRALIRKLKRIVKKS